MKKRRLTTLTSATDALLGRTITGVGLGLLGPAFVLDDGTEVTFDVEDHGSGTYVVHAEVERKRKKKS